MIKQFQEQPWWRATIVPAILLGIGGLGTTAHATVFNVVTDTTWRTADQLPAPGWNTDLNYDDSSWTTPAIYGLWDIPANGPLYLGINNPNNDYENWFRKSFTISGTPVASALNFAFDDDGDVYINGNLVWHDRSGMADNSSGGNDVTPYLVQGENLIAVYQVNSFGFGWWAAGGLQVQDTSVPEPTSLALLVLGGMGIWSFRVRKEA